MNDSEKLKEQTGIIIKTVLKYYPDVQAVYLFGSHGSADERPDSDIDIAVLFSPPSAGRIGALSMSDLKFELEEALGRKADVVNLRLMNTIFQKEIIEADERIYCADEYRADEFEMLTISKYQRLNEERRGIIDSVLAGGNFYNL
ncbi:MAG: nucleotidyltransferase domain-containing protein [Elusimicrobia bacterium CG_4_10_14_3_um_filter_49_12_50_7]|nr:MAG: nucleotidyltransferase domain-containing protein [Elusimicrobia bacterium CG_4_8_14_3_um_filter_50_9]PIY16600.1 MAG: nucleotidyltransferase domain-containing protein [Elusimicrobia bacterium CG_4_10_14_3_um_filter_49_12_50_7]